MSRNTFQQWMEAQQKALEDEEEVKNNDEQVSFLTQLSSIQDRFTNQLQELSGSLPEAGPLSAAFRQRALYSIYCLGGSFGFAILAIFIGLPTLIIRPAKFVLCMTLSTLLAAASVIILQKPTVFFSNLLKGSIETSLPVLGLLISLILTIYVTIFIHKYVYVILFGCLQMFSLLYYLSSFIPGGTKGLIVLLKTGYAILSTMLTPCLFVCKKSVLAFVNKIFS